MWFCSNFLTTTYNSSLVLTYNFARGGATVDSDIVRPLFGTSTSFKQQVEAAFLPNYNSSIPSFLPKWTAKATLFIFFFGINDISMSAPFESDVPIDAIITQYGKSVEQVCTIRSRFTAPCGSDARLSLSGMQLTNLIALRWWCTQLPIHKCSANQPLPTVSRRFWKIPNTEHHARRPRNHSLQRGPSEATR